MSSSPDYPSQVPPRPGGGRPELVVIAKPEAGLRAVAAGPTSVTDADTTSLASLLDTHGAAMRPLFGLSEDRVRAQVEALPAPSATAAKGEAEPPPDLALFYRVAADEDRLDELAEDLLADDLVEAAYVKPAGEPPSTTMETAEAINAMQPDLGDAPPATPSFVAREGYLAVAPGGLDAQFAWTLSGGRGQGVKVIDCEWAWRFTHEDLLQNQGGVVAGTSRGTPTTAPPCSASSAVIRTAIGITGIAPDAVDQRVVVQRPVDVAGDQGRGRQAWAWRHHPAWRSTVPAPEHAEPGAGPAGLHRHRVVARRLRRHPLRGAEGHRSWSRRPATASRTSTTPSTTLGRAASQRVGGTRSTPATRRRARCVVGAGAPPPNTHGADWGPDRSRLDFSNYGARVDVQGWGREVTTTGYGDLQGGQNEDLWYTDRFSGTSSASPVVVGALACTQGVLRSRGHRRLTSDRARRAGARLAVRLSRTRRAGRRASGSGIDRICVSSFRRLPASRRAAPITTATAAPRSCHEPVGHRHSEAGRRPRWRRR